MQGKQSTKCFTMFVTKNFFVRPYTVISRNWCLQQRLLAPPVSIIHITASNVYLISENCCDRTKKSLCMTETITGLGKTNHM